MSAAFRCRVDAHISTTQSFDARAGGSDIADAPEETIRVVTVLTSEDSQIPLGWLSFVRVLHVVVRKANRERYDGKLDAKEGGRCCILPQG